jgi:hypothetical protein
MVEQPSKPEKPSRLRRIARATGKGIKEKAGVVVVASALTLPVAHLPAEYTNRKFREWTGHDEAENQAIRKRLTELRQRKEELGITKDGTPQLNIPGRIKHFWERLTKEFGGEINKWVKESEPILALRVQNVRMLEFIDWLSYYPIFGFIFILVLPRIYRRLDTYVDRLRGRLLEQKVGEHDHSIEQLKERIATLEKDSGELKNLTTLVNALMQKDTMGKLEPSEIEEFRQIISRTTQIIESLPTEVVPDEIKPKEKE